jgi:hypothetical protein
MQVDGLPTFAITEVEVTNEESENGVQYGLAHASLLERGYEEPFVHFGNEESPPFLHAAVKEYLGSATPDAVLYATP